MLYGALQYEKVGQDEAVFLYGDEPADKLYFLLDGEVRVEIPEPKIFEGECATGEIIGNYLIGQYEIICWKKMPKGEKVQEYLLSKLSDLKVKLVAYSHFNKQEALEKLKMADTGQMSDFY